MPPTMESAPLAHRVSRWTAFFRQHTRLLRSLFVALIMALTFWFMGKQIYLAYSELQTRSLTLRYDYLALAVVFDATGLLALSIPMYLVLRDRKQRLNAPYQLGWPTVAQAYIMSQVGKYVPGKAVVVLIRYMVMNPLGVSIGMVVLATFVETVSSMSAASLLSFLLISIPIGTLGEIVRAEAWWFRPLSLFFFLGLFFLVMPPVLAVAPKLLYRVSEQARKHADRPLAWSTVGLGLLWGLVAWMMFGLSFWSVVQSVCGKDLGLQEIPTLSAVFAVSYVAGFVSMVPGHFGVREFMMDVVLRPLVGGDSLVAVAATLLSRLITLGVELVVGVTLYLHFRWTHTPRAGQVDTTKDQPTVEELPTHEPTD